MKLKCIFCLQCQSHVLDRELGDIPGVLRNSTFLLVCPSRKSYTLICRQKSPGQSSSSIASLSLSPSSLLGYGSFPLIHRKASLASAARLFNRLWSNPPVFSSFSLLKSLVMIVDWWVCAAYYHKMNQNEDKSNVVMRRITNSISHHDFKPYCDEKCLHVHIKWWQHFKYAPLEISVSDRRNMEASEVCVAAVLLR
jgi:hypothetical protein